MKKFYLFLVLSFASIPVLAQIFEKPSTIKKGDYISSFYLELGGNSLLGSFNYDLVLPSKFGIRIGASPTLFFSKFDTEEI